MIPIAAPTRARPQINKGMEPNCKSPCPIMKMVPIKLRVLARANSKNQLTHN